MAKLVSANFSGNKQTLLTLIVVDFLVGGRQAYN